MTAWYNEIDDYAADWLENLIAAGHIADGVVDRRSIAEVQPDDVRGFDQCHFFAGIGGWSYALRLAGWPDDRPVWTGSCPCQPFSAAGKRKGVEDERHLWPEFRRLIAECAPATVFGEQVASKDGRLWLAGVRADLEALGYAVGAADLCAAGVGAPHIRQRLWWVGYSDREGCGFEPERNCHSLGGCEETQLRLDPDGSCASRRVADASSGRGRVASRPVQAGEGRSTDARPDAAREHPEGLGGRSRARRMADADGGFSGDRHLQPGGQHGLVSEDGRAGRMAFPENEQSHRSVDGRRRRQDLADRGRMGDAGREGFPERGSDGRLQREAVVSPPWETSLGTGWLGCTDGKARRVESGTFPLAHGVPNRVGRLRAYGNAIVPQVAAEFIRACEECRKV